MREQVLWNVSNTFIRSASFPISLPSRRTRMTDSKAPLAICKQSKKNWIGLVCPSINTKAIIAAVSIDSAKWKQVPRTADHEQHLTLLYGFDVKDWAAARDVVVAAGLTANDVVFSDKARFLPPQRAGGTTGFVILDTEPEKSPKLYALKQALKTKFATPDNHLCEIPIHTTLAFYEQI